MCGHSIRFYFCFADAWTGGSIVSQVCSYIVCVYSLDIYWLVVGLKAQHR